MTKQHPKGFATLLAVIIVGAIASMIAIYLIAINIDVTKNTIDIDKSLQARANAENCAERALNSIALNVTYSGRETFSLERGSCEIRLVINPGSQTPTIEVVGTVDNVVRKSRLVLTAVNPVIEIGSWLDVPDF